MSPITLIFIALLLYIAKRVWASYTDPAWAKIPGPSYRFPFLGNYYDIVLVNTGASHAKWVKQFGPAIRYYAFGLIRVMFSDPAVVKYVLLNNHLFDKNLFQYQIMVDSFGAGLVTQMDEAAHKYHRNIISPAFAHKHLKALVPIFHKKGEILVEDWLAQADTGAIVSIKKFIAKATSDVIGEAAFGYQLQSQRDDSASSVYNIFAAVLGEKMNLFSYLKGIQHLVPDYHTRTNAVKSLDKQVQIIINQKTEKRLSKPNKIEEESTEMRDLLDIMMDCVSEEGAVLTRDELADQTKTFLLAGYETSSVCILWTMHLLSRNPEIQKRLAAEVISVIGKDRNPTAEDIDKMPYMYNVLRESLRICPPIPYVFRRAVEDTMVGGYLIPKGTIILVNIYHQHHDPAVWKNPEVFDPERWNSEDTESTHLFGSYIPFILGARNCIGQKFAMLEVRVLLAMILQKLSFVPEPNQKEDLGRHGTIAMVPRTPVQLIFSKRT